jgi:hypothetical protein
MRALLERLATCSTRPRYTFMLLSLIAEVARPDGSAGPVVPQPDGHVPLRDWLCDGLTPMGQRDPRRLALQERVRMDLKAEGRLDPGGEENAIAAEVRQRVRAAGKCNLSRAVSELVRAGLLRRHYQGYRVDHHNRGAQRQAVYTLMADARTLLAGKSAASPPSPSRQRELPL